jgi:hypothetical protein
MLGNENILNFLRPFTGITTSWSLICPKLTYTWKIKKSS